MELSLITNKGRDVNQARMGKIRGALLPIFLATLILPIFCGCKKKKAPPAAPPEVQFIVATETNVPIFQEWIGTLDGFVNAQIRAQVTGYLLSQNYVEGSQVKKGDLLWQIDPRPFQAVVDQTLAKLAQDQAQQGKTELDVKRYTPLVKEQAVSQEELDNAVQANLAAIAQVKADQATIETAKLNLSFTSITSPVDGLAGVALAQVGDLVSQGSNPLTTVSTIDPIKVYFQVSEESYLTFWRRFIESGTNAPDAPLRLILSDNSTFDAPGKFYALDRQVNANTGTLQIVGVFPNTNYILRPGQYGRVRAQTQTKTNAVVVPQRAVGDLQGTRQVVVVDDQNKTHIKNVTIGDQVGNQWIIEKGLNSGEHVVIEGTQKAKEGTVVNPQPYVPGTNAPSTNAAPGQPAPRS